MLGKVFLHVDAGKIDQVVRNLLTNAVRQTAIAANKRVLHLYFTLILVVIVIQRMLLVSISQ